MLRHKGSDSKQVRWGHCPDRVDILSGLMVPSSYRSKVFGSIACVILLHF